MHSSKKLLAMAAFAAMSAAHAQTTYIGFEGLPDPSVVTNQYPGVLFASSGTTVEVSTYGQSSWGTAAPMIACPLGDTRGYCSADLIVNFTTPVSSVGYLYTGDNFSGLLGTATYYSGASVLATHNLFGDGNPFTSQAESFAYSAGITKLVVRLDNGEANLAGLGYDDFRLAPVPEPETYALMIAGLAFVGALARRRRIG